MTIRLTLKIPQIRAYSVLCHLLENAVLAEAKLKPEYEKLLTVPGIWKILALTIMLETGDIGRFKKVGNYSSYCRCVKSSRLSNEKTRRELDGTGVTGGDGHQREEILVGCKVKCRI